MSGSRTFRPTTVSGGNNIFWQKRTGDNFTIELIPETGVNSVFITKNLQVANEITVTSSEKEGKFTYKMLDLPAQEQVMAIGLVKTIFTELNDSQVEKLFNELGLTDIEKPKDGEEYDFNLNTSELSLRIVPIGQNGGREIWKSTKFDNIKTLLKSLGIDIEKNKFEDIFKAEFIFF